MSRRNNFLDANRDAMEYNLRFVNNDMEQDVNRFFGNSNDRPDMQFNRNNSGNSYSGNGSGGIDRSQSGNYFQSGIAPPRESKTVTPKPGFCIKSFKVNTNEKYFINVCQTDEIPAPEDITEEELTQILLSEEPSSFRIPMSISEPRVTKDKSNNPVDVCDIALNPKFFVKCEKSSLFKEFFLTLIGEALSDKYNVQLKIDKSIILNNRKFIGTLVSHRVRNNDVKNVLKSYDNPTEADKKQLIDIEKKSGINTRGPLVQEIDSKELNELKQKTIEQQKLSEKNISKIKQEISLAASTVPEFKLRAKLREEQVEELQAEFHLPKCISSQELTLDIGEDRILLESMKHGYIFDKFINYRLNQERARAIFDKTNKMLQVRIPVYPVP